MCDTARPEVLLSVDHGGDCAAVKEACGNGAADTLHRCDRALTRILYFHTHTSRKLISTLHPTSRQLSR